MIFATIPFAMKKPLSQIAFDFAMDPSEPPAETIAPPSASVGVRLKSLKKEVPAIHENEEIAVLEPPAVQNEPIDVQKIVVAEAPVTTLPPPRVKSTRGRKSLKQSSAEADLIEIPDDETLFLKQYYSMSEVAGMFRVNQSLLRFWETEFSILQPRKNKKGDRHFRPVDIKNLHLIYHLLRQRKYTIEGAKEFLKKNKKAEERFDAIKRLQQVRGFLLEWKAQL
jgi:DNA-binding transcriptional MerR regulator